MKTLKDYILESSESEESKIIKKFEDADLFNINKLDTKIIKPYLDWKMHRRHNHLTKDEAKNIADYVYDLINDPKRDIWDEFEPKEEMAEFLSMMEEECRNIYAGYRNGILR